MCMYENVYTYAVILQTTAREARMSAAVGGGAAAARAKVCKTRAIEPIESWAAGAGRLFGWSVASIMCVCVCCSSLALSLSVSECICSGCNE